MDHLTGFIRSNGEQIVTHWVEFAATLRPFGPGTDVATLQDAVGAMLLEMAARMDAPESIEQQIERSRGHSDASAAQPSTAWRHGIERLEAGLDINEVVAEFRALRSVVLRLYRAANALPELTPDDVIAFDAAIDQAIAESLAAYTWQLEKLRNTLLAVLAHDLRSPLHAITITVEALHHFAPPTPRVGAMIDRIRNGAGRMADLIDDFLAFLTPTLGGAIPIERAPFDMADACHFIVDEVGSGYPPGRIVFRHGGDTHGRWDRSRVEQILANLLRNAVDHGDAQRAVTLTAIGTHDGSVRVEVHNDGEPIPPGALQAIFKPLVQLSNSPERRRGHLGLGLFIAKELIERHGGRIHVQSTAQDGTTFSFILPRS